MKTQQASPDFQMNITGELITHSLKESLENPNLDPNIKMWSYINFVKRMLTGNTAFESYQLFIKELQSEKPIQDITSHLGLSNQTDREKVLKYIEQDVYTLTNAENITDINIHALSYAQYLSNINPPDVFTLPA